MSKILWFLGGCVTGIFVAGTLASFCEETSEEDEESMDDIFATEERVAVACIPVECAPKRNTYL